MTNIKSLIDRATKVEPQITDDIISIINTSGGKMGGLEFRLKSLPSLKRKIETEIMAGLSEEQAIASIRDIIRYTAILDEQKFIEQYQRIQECLEKEGYTTIIVKNTWVKGAIYKGINTFVSTFIEKDNTIFELQFHTKQSFELKSGKLHKLYEKFREPSVPQSEKEKIFLEMQQLRANLRQPQNIDLIKEKK